MTRTMAPAKSARAKKFAAFEDKAVKGMRASFYFTEANKHTVLSDSITCRLRSGSESPIRGRKRQ